MRTHAGELPRTLCFRPLQTAPYICPLNMTMIPRRRYLRLLIGHLPELVRCKNTAGVPQHRLCTCLVASRNSMSEVQRSSMRTTTTFHFLRLTVLRRAIPPISMWPHLPQHRLQQCSTDMTKMNPIHLTRLLSRAMQLTAAQRQAGMSRHRMQMGQQCLHSIKLCDARAQVPVAQSACLQAPYKQEERFAIRPYLSLWRLTNIRLYRGLTIGRLHTALHPTRRLMMPRLARRTSVWHTTAPSNVACRKIPFASWLFSMINVMVHIDHHHRLCSDLAARENEIENEVDLQITWLLTSIALTRSGINQVRDLPSGLSLNPPSLLPPS